MPIKIKHVQARQLLDCKCRPMVEVDVITDNGFIGRGSAPTGTSVGMHEAYVLRDQDPSEFRGLSVHNAVKNVNQVIAPRLIGMDVMNQLALDNAMITLDGTSNKRNLGSNAIYSTSIACYRAAAAIQGIPLYRYIAGRGIKTVPIPSFNVINGGHYDDFTQPFNEFILMPYRAASISQAVEIGVHVYQELQNVLKTYLGRSPSIGSSYGYSAPSEDPEIILSLMAQAVDHCGYKEQVAFALDCASSEMFDKDTNTYLLKGNRITANELIDYVKLLSEKYNLVFVEDLLDENDWDHYPIAKQEITRTIILGDDLIVSSMDRLKKAYAQNAIDGFVLKPNQIGTISEALDAYDYAVKHQLLAIPSGRSGGVIDDVVMDLAVGLEVPFIKNGAPRSGERIEKLNFLMRANDLNPGCTLAKIDSIVKF